MEEPKVNSDRVNSPPEMDTGLICLVMLARFHNIALSPEQISHQFATSNQGVTLNELLLAARQSGIKARSFTSRSPDLNTHPCPPLPLIGMGHFSF